MWRKAESRRIFSFDLLGLPTCDIFAKSCCGKVPAAPGRQHTALLQRGWLEWAQYERLNKDLVFQWRHFAPKVILLCVRWYCKYGIRYREIEEMMAERSIAVDRTTI
jgi:hypothetical protein